MTIREYLKTLLQGVKTYVDEKIVKSDWNVNDENSTSYIKNRTHYIDFDQIVHPESTVSREESILSTDVYGFEEGKTYNVTFDGTVYPCTYKWDDRSMGGFLGNATLIETYESYFEDTGEPFCIREHHYYIIQTEIYTKDTGTHTIKIDDIVDEFTVNTVAGENFMYPSITSGETYTVHWDGVDYTLQAYTGTVETDYVYLGNANLLNPNEPASTGNEPFVFMRHLGYLKNALSLGVPEGLHTYGIEGILPTRERFFWNVGHNYSDPVTFDTSISLDYGKEYTVVFDNIEYECQVKTIMGQVNLIGNKALFDIGQGAFFRMSDSKEPFIIYGYNDTYYINTMYPGSHTITIKGDVYNTINKKFLPKLIGEIGEGDNAEIFNDYTNNKAVGSYSHAEGYQTTASGDVSHAEGDSTTASGTASHAEGALTTASGQYSHAEGWKTTASKREAHVEGALTTASGRASHAEGYKTTASGFASHVEGNSTVASEYYSHAEGDSTTASGTASHAEGALTTASGQYSHAEGQYTTASGDHSHVQGKYNIEDTESKYAHIVGNGTAEDARSNAHTVDWSGNAWFAGKVYVGGTSQDDAIELGVKDWNVNDETNPAFIKNRPFYGDEQTTSITHQPDEFMMGTHVYFKESPKIAPFTFPVKVGDVITVNYQGTDYELTAVSTGSSDRDIQYGAIGNELGFQLDINSTTYEYGIQIHYSKGIPTMPLTISFTNGEIKKIDPKYLPDDIGGGDTLPTGSEILIDADAEVPEGWEVVDEVYDASEVYLSDGRNVEAALNNAKGMFKLSTTSVSVAAQGTVPFNSTLVNTGDFTLSNGKITVNKNMIASISAHICGNAVNNRLWAILRINGTNVAHSLVYGAYNTGTFANYITEVSAGDVIDIIMSEGSISLNTDGHVGTYISIIEV